MWLHSAAAGLTRRPASTGDLPFLFQVYASGRTAELASVPWTDEQKSQFLAMQATAQDADYSRNYPRAERWIIERDDVAIGRLYLDRRETSNHLLDIALLPHARRKGWGTALLSDVIDEAAGEDKAVTIYVESFNPAKRLYERLGFRQVEERPPYLLMRRDAPFN